LILNTVVLWAHIFGAIGWLGSGMVFAVVVGPGLSILSPQSRVEFLVKILPKYLRYVEGFSMLTIVFGVVAAAVFLNGNFSSISFSTSFGLYITAGALLALVGVAMAFSVIIPTARRIVGFAEALTKAPGPPPAEMLSAAERLRLSSTVAVFVLIAVTVLMVAGATL
jgi:uncharacterized membrane protein